MGSEIAIIEIISYFSVQFSPISSAVSSGGGGPINAELTMLISFQCLIYFKLSLASSIPGVFFKCTSGRYGSS